MEEAEWECKVAEVVEEAAVEEWVVEAEEEAEVSSLTTKWTRFPSGPTSHPLLTIQLPLVLQPTEGLETWRKRSKTTDLKRAMAKGKGSKTRKSWLETKMENKMSLLPQNILITCRLNRKKSLIRFQI